MVDVFIIVGIIVINAVVTLTFMAIHVWLDRHHNLFTDGFRVKKEANKCCQPKAKEGK